MTISNIMILFNREKKKYMNSSKLMLGYSWNMCRTPNDFIVIRE